MLTTVNQHGRDKLRELPLPERRLNVNSTLVVVAKICRPHVIVIALTVGVLSYELKSKSK